MVRSELLQKLCNNHPNLRRSDLNKILRIVFHEISEALCRGDKLELRHFGILKTVKRKARVARNPRTNEQIKIGEKLAVNWKMGKTLFNRLNKI
tara:strand:- start:449 stop:730 length:282 start_codon:yes stop_codon:yes gene_type:complete